MALPDLVVRGAALLVAAAAIVLFILFLAQRSLVYVPGPAPAGDRLPPGVEVLEVRTDDGLQLAAWFVPAAAAVTGQPREPAPGPAVLICNGNAGDRSHRLGLAVALAARGYGVLLFDYRGYGGNPGRPTEAGLRADARAAVAALAARSDVDPERLAYFGESLGAAVAGGLATERPPAALILRSPPSSLADVGRHHYPFLPIVEPLLFDRYPLVDQIRTVRAPVLVVVTEGDQIVPAALSRRVYDAAPGPKRYLAIAAAHHNDPALFLGEEFLAEVTAFLDHWLAEGGGG